MNKSILLFGILLLMCRCMNEDSITGQENIKIENLIGKRLGIPVSLPPFNPEKDIPKAPDYDNPKSWISLPSYFNKENNWLMFSGFTQLSCPTAQPT